MTVPEAILLGITLSNTIVLILLGRTLITQGRIIRNLRGQREKERIYHYVTRPDIE